MQKTIQAVQKYLLIRVLNKLKPDYEIFNYKIPFERMQLLPKARSFIPSWRWSGTFLNILSPSRQKPTVFELFEVMPISSIGGLN